MSDLQNLINKLNKQVPGYHLYLTLYPAGGEISAYGCEECGTSEEEFDYEMWYYKRGESLDSATEKLRARLGLPPQGEQE